MLCACCRGWPKGNPTADRVWPFARRESYPVGGRVLPLSVSLLVVAVRTRTGQISGCVCLRVGTEGPIDVCPPYADSERARRKFPPSSRCAQFVSGAGCRRPAPATEDRTGVDACGTGAIPMPVYLSCAGTGYAPAFGLIDSRSTASGPASWRPWSGHSPRAPGNRTVSG